MESHQTLRATRKELSAHNEAWMEIVDGTVLLQQVPGCLGETQDDGRGRSNLEVDNIAVLIAQFLEAEPGPANTDLIYLGS